MRPVRHGKTGAAAHAHCADLMVTSSQKESTTDAAQCLHIALFYCVYHPQATQGLNSGAGHRDRQKGSGMS